MALSETARLIASLELKDKFSKTADRAIGKVGKMESSFGRLGGIASKGIATATRNVAAIGAIGAVAIGTQVKAGLSSLAELESATTSVDAAIKQMGQSGQLAGSQVAGWANEIESAVGAAFDDKEITAAASTLLRFGKVAPKNLRPALEVMTDLAVKTGSVDSAASLLAKALADPEKAAGKLARTGIILTKAQQKQIKALVKSGKVAEAQALILGELEKSTKGAALASQGPYARSLATLADVTEDAQRALAEGFLPVIERVRDILQKQLAKPETMQAIRDFGKGAAAGLDRLVDVATKIPWSSIGDAMKLAGTGAKAALDFFTGLPPWVQTAVLSGWGLNKLTGGALGSIVGELGKGLIKGVLGMTAGVVNINAGVVNGGGVPGVGPGAGGGVAGLIKGGIKFVLPIAAGVLIANAIREVAGITPEETANVQSNHRRPFRPGENRTENDNTRGNTNPQASSAPIVKKLGDTNSELVGVKSAIYAAQTAAAANAARIEAAENRASSSVIDTTRSESAGIRQAVAANVAATNRAQQAAFATRDAVSNTSAAVRALQGTTRSELAGVRTAQGRTTGAISSKRWQFTVQNTIPVTVSVSSRDSFSQTKKQSKTQTIQ